MGSLRIVSVHLDQRDAATRFYISGKCLQIGLAVFDVMKHVMKETQIDVTGRQLGITEFPLDRWIFSTFSFFAF